MYDQVDVGRNIPAPNVSFAAYRHLGYKRHVQILAQCNGPVIPNFRHQQMLHHHCDFSFSYHSSQRERFRDGSLVREWSDRYPNLFDDDDRRVLKTEHQKKYHFLEWLSAILLFESTGYLSFVEKYTTKSHPQKRHKLEAFLPPKLFNWLCEHESGQPDLFVYQPVTKDWFFCEVKGETDRVRDNQLEWSTSLSQFLLGEGISSERRTRVLCLQQVDA